MASTYTLKDFLRRASNQHLARYFAAQDLLETVDFAAIGETDVEVIQAAIDEVPNPTRDRVERDFQMVHDLASDHGLQIILEETAILDGGSTIAEVVTELDDLFSQSFHVFLDYPGLFTVAHSYWHADSLPQRYWRRRIGLPSAVAATDNVTRDGLKAALTAYFRQKQGRGRFGEVDVYQREHRTYYFAYLEDYGRENMEWADGSLQRLPRRPAFEVIFVYSQQEASLDIYVEARNDTVADLQVIFGRVVLDVELGPPPRDGRVYELNRFMRRGFQFIFDPLDKIEDVRVKKLRFHVVGGKGNSITAIADASRDRDAVYALLENVMGLSGSDEGTYRSGIPLALLNITQVGLQVTFAADGRGKRLKKSFDISYPNHCSLRYDGPGLLLREMLRQSGIELVSPDNSGAPPS